MGKRNRDSFLKVKWVYLGNVQTLLDHLNWLIIITLDFLMLPVELLPFDLEYFCFYLSILFKTIAL